ncbi:helix-turn-helix transcriptional regulator [Plantibacter sp. lyk4-40-MEA-4]|uniref:helix-turn-helix domain-containing protein n=1 Tax=Plantibacter sp. lyk4-40-MEA-4 TaxID=3040298 RepID=UPI00254AC5B4|nr:helix-turn-helix transcriptional regulator [Plantibacter sp. lyk4-40-MEA-4]
MEPRKRISANLRAIRQSRSLTQEGLAEKLGVTTRYLAGIERGERNLTLESAEDLAQDLEVDPLVLVSFP